ncbi:MAG: acyl-CoA thioesterase [Caldisphaeraceae archaeon]|nr:acyl-CoA thioesterase [Caldisphaeraceae archaeon]MEB3691774.1 acyl-CoA thioesterase [Caldisphaeraceae archaeon]MEB3798582.1 acyl-CoA thioesterase [Caldisphaeraceae archaeon]
MKEKKCSRKLSPFQTLTTTLFQVMPMHANPLGLLFGGVMEDWMVQVSNMEATRVARRPTLLAGMDNIFFISPVLVGENAMITAWVDYIGNTSIDVSLLVEAENPVLNERRLTTLAHMTYVAVGKDLRPVATDVCIEPRSNEEESLYEDAVKRREQRQRRISDRKKKALDVSPPKGLGNNYAITNYRVVMPEDAMGTNTLFAGKLMKLLDEATALVGVRYSRGPVVTASVDTTDFYSPVMVGDTLIVYSTLTYVGKSSMEVLAKVVKRDEINGEERHTTTSYFTLVHIGPTGRSEPIPAFNIKYRYQKEMFSKAEKRRASRLENLNTFKENAERIVELVNAKRI